MHPGIQAVITPHEKDLGGFSVRRVLPSVERRAIGPFIFFDQMGPATFAAGRGLDVRPHPHIGLGTVTYLFEGSILHRDTLGTVQLIEPGAINWMVAGRGIAHSERTDAPSRLRGSPLSGLQTWLALPLAEEERAPSFVHHPAASLPVVSGEGLQVRILIGSAFGARSPVASFQDTVYADIALEPGATLRIPAEHEEQGLFVARGPIAIGDARFETSQMLMLDPAFEIVISAPEGARVMLLGGDRLDAPRHLWWNFVSSSADRIETAKEDWKAGRFGPVPDDPEFIPLPD